MTITLSALLQGALTTLPVASGGTGASTLTGIIKGSGTSALSAAVSGTDIKTINSTSLLGSGDITITPKIVRSARTSNTILAAADNNTLIDITSGTFSQTFTAAATLGSGWYCYVGNSGTGFVTLDPNSTETITVNGTARTTWVLWPGEMGLIVCNGSEFYYYCIQKGEITQTISGTPASLSFSTGLAYRRKMLLSIENFAESSGGDPLFKINTATPDNWSQLRLNNTTLTGYSGTIGSLTSQGVKANETGSSRLSASILLQSGPVSTRADYSTAYFSASPTKCFDSGQSLWATITEATISTIDIYPGAGNITAGTFILREL